MRQFFLSYRTDLSTEFALSESVKNLNICLLSHQDVWSREIGRLVNSQPDLSLYQLLNEEDFHNSSARVDALLLREDPFLEKHLPKVYRFRICYPRTSIVVVSAEADVNGIKHLNQYKRTGFIDLQTEIYDLPSVIKKLQKSEKVGCRAFKRKRVRRNMRLNVLNSDFSFRGELLDISKSGAKCRVESAHFRPRSRVQVSFIDEKTGELQTREAQVNWEQTIQGLHQRNQVVGLQYLT